MLLHSEASTTGAELPEPFAIMTVGAIVERHLRLLSAANGIAVKEDASKGSITYYVGSSKEGESSKCMTQGVCDPWATFETRPLMGGSSGSRTEAQFVP